MLLKEDLLVEDPPPLHQLVQASAFGDDVVDQLEHFCVSCSHAIAGYFLPVFFGRLGLDEEARLIGPQVAGLHALEDAHGSLNNIIALTYYIQFVMGNTCENCEKPTNPKDALREDAGKEEEKIGKAVEEESKP